MAKLPSWAASEQGLDFFLFPIHPLRLLEFWGAVLRASVLPQAGLLWLELLSSLAARVYSLGKLQGFNEQIVVSCCSGQLSILILHPFPSLLSQTMCVCLSVGAVLLDCGVSVLGEEFGVCALKAFGAILFQPRCRGGCSVHPVAKVPAAGWAQCLPLQWGSQGVTTSPSLSLPVSLVSLYHHCAWRRCCGWVTLSPRMCWGNQRGFSPSPCWRAALSSF